MNESSGKKPDVRPAGQKTGEGCDVHCVIGLEDCVECGICEHCSDGVKLDEDTLPPHWNEFIENSRKKG